MSETRSAIPLTIVCGFLGSGKTTLVRRLLDQLVAQGKKVAIIQNEFSDTGVEDAMVVGDDGEVFNDITELANGCVCCTVRDDFVTALETLCAQRKFDYFLLECSGLARVGPLASMFWIDYELESELYLDGVVCVLDTMTLDDHLDLSKPESKQIVEQVAFADRVLLNKQDLVTEQHTNQVQDKVRVINPIATVFHTTQSDISSSKILDIKAYDTTDIDDIFQHRNQFLLPHTLTHGHDSQPPTHVQSHQHGITSVVLEGEPGSLVDEGKLKQWLADILWTNTTRAAFTGGDELEVDPTALEVYRLKAVLNVKDREGNSAKHYLQGVGELFELEEGDPWKEDETPCTRVVIMGRLVADKEEELRRGFMATFVQ